MPLHEYKCRKCRHVFEKIQKFSDKPEADCPKCGSAGERQLSAPAVHFKGAGWYITDSRKDKKDKKDKKDRDSKAKKASSGKGSSDNSSSDTSSSDKSKSGDSSAKKSSDKPKDKS